jgi:hypothetical protein
MLVVDIKFATQIGELPSVFQYRFLLAACETMNQLQYWIQVSWVQASSARSKERVVGK